MEMPQVLPSFIEARDILVAMEGDDDPVATVRMLIELLGDYDGRVAASLMWLFMEFGPHNALSAMTAAFLAGTFRERDKPAAE